MPDLSDSIPTPPQGDSTNLPEYASNFAYNTADSVSYPLEDTFTNPIPADSLTIVSPSTVYGERSVLVNAYTSERAVGEGIQRGFPIGGSWVFLLYVAILLLALLVVRYARKSFRQLPVLLASAPLAHKAYKSGLQQLNRTIAALFYFSIVPILGLAFYIAQNYTTSLNPQLSTYTALLIAGTVVIFIVAKIVILYVAGVLTHSEALAQELRYNIKLFMGAWGLFAFPLVLLMVMNSGTPEGSILFYAMGALSLAMYGLYLLRSLQLFISEKISLFFWILYLCALEVLPVLLVLDYLFSI